MVREGDGQGAKTGNGENVRVEVYRTFLGNNWNEKGELKGRFVGGKVVGVAGGEGGDGNGNGNGQENLRGEEELKIELEVLGRREYYTARERCKFLYLPLHILFGSFCDDVGISFLGSLSCLESLLSRG